MWKRDSTGSQKFSSCFSHCFAVNLGQMITSISVLCQFLILFYLKPPITIIKKEQSKRNPFSTYSAYPYNLSLNPSVCNMAYWVSLSLYQGEGKSYEKNQVLKEITIFNSLIRGMKQVSAFRTAICKIQG